MSEIDKYENGVLTHWTSIDGTIWHNDKVVQQLKESNKTLNEMLLILNNRLNEYKRIYGEL